MGEIIDGFIGAIQLIVTLDPEVMDIALRSIQVSTLATLIAALIAIPLGALIYFYDFPGKRGVINVVQTLYALPTVIVGLVVYLLISHSGPLGFLDLLYTTTKWHDVHITKQRTFHHFCVLRWYHTSYNSSR